MIYSAEGAALIDVVVHTLTKRVSGQRLMLSFHAYETPDGRLGADIIYIIGYNHRSNTSYEMEATADDWGSLGFGQIAEMASDSPELGRLCRAMAGTLRVDEGTGVLHVACGE